MKKLGLFVLLIVLALGAGVMIKSCFIKDGGENDNQKKEVVSNSALDGSVHQVKDYLKGSLNDWGSYESVEWSPVKKVSGVNYDFVVRHKYRAKNGFGGVVLVNQMFYLDAAGKVVRAEEWK